MSPWRTGTRQVVPWPVSLPLDDAALRAVDRASFGWVRPFVELGAPRQVDGSIVRDIRGGRLARAPGGRVGTGVVHEAGRDRVESWIDEYAPRVPRVLYETFQLRVHHAVVRAAVRHAARRLRRQRRRAW